MQNIWRDKSERKEEMGEFNDTWRSRKLTQFMTSKVSNSLFELDSGSNGWGARKSTDATKRPVLLPRFGSIKRALWALTKYDIIVLLWPALNKWVCQHIEWQTVERMETTAAKRERLDNEEHREQTLSTGKDEVRRWMTTNDDEEATIEREEEREEGKKVRKTRCKRWREIAAEEQQEEGR